MKLPVKISGYAGEHDEAGAMIVDADGKIVCTTAGVENASSGDAWKEYYTVAQAIVDGLNNIERYPVE
jgi:hypothetical protein